VKLYTGNSSTQTISGLGFSPDLVWVKNRSNSASHRLTDVIRGGGYSLFSNLTNAEVLNDDNGYIASLNADGFTVSAGASDALGVNQSSNTYAAWCWDAGSSTVTNTQGSITSQVRANATAGFSVVTWTGTGTAGTIGHGLGVAPGMIIVKARSTADAWYVYHSSLGATKRIQLNETSAETAGTSVWNSTSPTSTVFSIGNGNPNSSGVTYVAYVFSPVVGYSSFGSFVGNGSNDGPMLYLGFRPRWFLYKDTTASNSWVLFDSARSTYNVTSDYLLPNAADAEASFGVIDFLSNGVKIRFTGGSLNVSNNTYIYAAFAESPFAANNRAR
jgi:hypothetical protein